MQHKINFPMVAVEKQTQKVFSFNLQCKTRHLFRVVSDHRKDSPQLGLLQTNLGNQNSPHGWVTSFLGNDRPDTFVSAAWWFPCKRGDGSFPHLEVSCSWERSPNTEPISASAVLMSKSTRKGWKRKGKVQNGSKDGFEVQPRSRDQEVRAVIAAGYQFPFLFRDRPQHAGVCPWESRQGQHSPLQGNRSCC